MNSKSMGLDSSADIGWDGDGSDHMLGAQAVPLGEGVGVATPSVMLSPSDITILRLILSGSVKAYLHLAGKPVEVDQQ